MEESLAQHVNLDFQCSQNAKCSAGGTETLSALIALSKYKAEEAPALLRRSAMSAWHKRWASLISVAAQIAVSESLVDPASPHFTENNGDCPPLGDVLAEAPCEPEVSRLPAH